MWGLEVGGQGGDCAGPSKQCWALDTGSPQSPCPHPGVVESMRVSSSACIYMTPSDWLHSSLSFPTCKVTLGPFWLRSSVGRYVLPLEWWELPWRVAVPQALRGGHRR